MSTQYVYGIVDRSGSMIGKELDTIGGINAAIDQLKQNNTENDNIKVYLKLFDHEQIILWDAIDISNVVPLSREQYIPRGGTALLDAMGDTLKYLIDKKNIDSELFDSAIVYITTDGLENQSKRYNQHTITSLITQAENNYNIRVIYLGANQNAIMEASKIGISPYRAMNYSENSQNIESAFRSAANVAFRTRSYGESAFTNTERQMSSQESAEIPIHPSRQNSVSQLNNPPQIARSPGLANEISNRDQHTFLDYAKERNFEKVKELVLSNSGYVNCVTTSNRWTALHQASYSGNIDIVMFLLNNGADKTIVNRQGFTPYEVANNSACKTLLS